MGNERKKERKYSPKTAAGSGRESKRKLKERKGMRIVANGTKSPTCGSDYDSMP